MQHAVPVLGLGTYGVVDRGLDFCRNHPLMGILDWQRDPDRNRAGMERRRDLNLVGQIYCPMVRRLGACGGARERTDQYDREGNKAATAAKARTHGFYDASGTANGERHCGPFNTEASTPMAGCRFGAGLG